MTAIVIHASFICGLGPHDTPPECIVNPPPEPVAHDTKAARRAGVTAFVGTTIEWFDFYIYGTASALVLGALFFPQVSPAVGTLAAFATFAVGFIARPLGGVIFGHFGDKFGRKNAVITTLAIMGIGTVGVGLLPTYSQIGIWAPILLVLLRVLQGIAMGGEWGAPSSSPRNSPRRVRRFSTEPLRSKGRRSGTSLRRWRSWG